MDIRLIGPVALLTLGALYQNFIAGSVEENLGVEPGTNQISLTDILTAEDGIIDLSPPRKVQVGNPEDLRRAGLYGWKSYEPGVAGEGDTIHVLDQIIAGHPGYQRRPKGPADYRMQAHSKSCTPRPPEAGERIVNANIGYTLTLSELHAYSEAEMAEDTQKWLASHYERPRSLNDESIVRDHYVYVADIAITDTSAPIYLILQNRERNALWNIHPAPGVRIAHIVTVGPKTVAINPPPGDYGVEMLRSATDCIPPVARQPQTWWRIFKMLEAERKDARRDEEKADIDRQLDALFENYKAYDAWFRSAFNMRSEDQVVGFDQTDYLLAGPPPATPEARVPYRPLEDSTVLVSEEDYIFAVRKKDRVAFMMELQRDFIATAAGGSLDLLYPEPIQRAVQ